MTLQTTLALAFHYLRLRALCFAVWVAFNPAAARAPAAAAVADAIATAVLEDPAPLGSDEEETALAARYAVEESWLRPHVVGDGGKAHGLFQQHNPAGFGDPLTQTKGWLALLHDGARFCPDHPAAPLSGGCDRAWKLADRRPKAAYEVLHHFNEMHPETIAEPDADEPSAPAAPAPSQIDANGELSAR